jgi:hypothetical protein
MLKKTIMLAMAMAVVAAFAVPAVASAGLWKHHATNIAVNKSITLTGQTLIHSGVVGGIECQTTGTLQLTAGTGTGHISKWGVDLDEAGSTVTSKCKATGFLAQCQVHSMVATGTGGQDIAKFPWIVHNKTKTVEVTTGEVHWGITGAFCPGATATFTPGIVTLTPNQTKTVTSFALSGNVQVHILDGTGKTVSTAVVAVTGTQTIVESATHPDSKPHTYSLE